LLNRPALSLQIFSGVRECRKQFDNLTGKLASSYKGWCSAGTFKALQGVVTTSSTLLCKIFSRQKANLTCEDRNES
jgi:hypothetical protein